MMQIDSPACWLTDDLWGKIFGKVKADAIETVNKMPQAWGSQPMMEARVLFARMHQLKLVCRSFYRIFQRHLELSDWLVPANICNDALPSLLLHALKTRNTLQRLTSLSGGPGTDIALAALLCPNPLLTEVTMVYTYNQTLSVLSAFISVKKCHFHAPHQPVNLTPLQRSLFLFRGPSSEVPFLQDLQLTTGHFYHLEYTHHLSSLHLTAAVLESHWACNCYTHCSCWTVDCQECILWV